jgi:benzylsuccinate CoA-transferase BbsF subunit
MTEDGRLPLEGVRILDLTHVWAGPLAMRVLGSFGAEVIKVESTRRYDMSRGEAVAGPGAARVFIYPNADPGQEPWNREGRFIERNYNKLGLTLDLTRPEGVEVFERLVKISDVVVESFRVGVMANFGLDYPRLRAVKPDIIMVSLSSQGQTGPERGYGSFGAVLEQTGGLAAITGYEPDAPTATGTFIPDPVVAALAAGLVVAALHFRRRTGLGLYIDLSQRETVTAIVGETIMDYVMNGRVQRPMGNRHPTMAPHGVYPCAGEDRWVAIAVGTDAEFAALCRVMGRPELAADGRFADVVSRLRHQDELDKIIADWTRQHDHLELMSRLQAAGVPAGAVLDGRELLADPHLQAREFFRELDQPGAGRYPVSFGGLKLYRTPARIIRPAPRLGEHNEYILGQLLGLSGEEIAALERDGVIGRIPVAAVRREVEASDG